MNKNIIKHIEEVIQEIEYNKKSHQILHTQDVIDLLESLKNKFQEFNLYSTNNNLSNKANIINALINVMTFNLDIGYPSLNDITMEKIKYIINSIDLEKN